jgi:hypothetical protein
MIAAWRIDIATFPVQYRSKFKRVHPPMGLNFAGDGKRGSD